MAGPGPGPLHVVAAVIVRDGRVLVAQRDGKGHLARKWEFPGGKIEAGETPEAALRREIREELGVGVRVGPSLVTVHHDYEEFSIELSFFLASIEEMELTLSAHVEVRWLAAGELDGLDWAPADLGALDAVRKALDG